MSAFIDGSTIRIRSPTYDPSLGLLKCSQTIPEWLGETWEKHAHRPCLGTLQKTLDGTAFEYRWITYEQVFQKACELANGLSLLGLSAGSQIGIYASNCPEWIISMIAAQMRSIILVPLYEVAGPKSIHSMIKLTKLSTVICSPNNIGNLADAAMVCHSIQSCILFGATNLDTSVLTRQGVTVHDWDVILNGGLKTSPSPVKSNRDTVYLHMFTSGDPNCVILTHGNITTAAASFTRLFNFLPTDVHMSYLPFAHIMEHITVLQLLRAGAAIGFWRGRIQDLWEDLKTLRPTILLGVPSIFNRIYRSVRLNLTRSNPILRFLFNIGFSSKKKLLANQQDTTFWDNWLFSKLSEPFGGRIRIIVSSAAPLTPKVADFLSICFCCPLVQAYGLTETTGALTITNPHLITLCGSVGTPLDCNEIKLVELNEEDLPVDALLERAQHEKSTPTSSNISDSSSQSTPTSVRNSNVTSNKTPTKRLYYGEICVKGPNVTQGYLGENGTVIRSPTLFDADGWLHTGDIGCWNQEKSALTIVGSIKNVFKLAQGEYVAVDYLQHLYNTGSNFVSQILIVGKSVENYIVAIVVPSSTYVSQWANSNQMDTVDFTSLCRHPAVKRRIFDDLVQLANSQHLRGFQIIRNLHLEPKPWTVENGFVNSKGQLLRHKLIKHYSETIDFLYSQPKMDADYTSKL